MNMLPSDDIMVRWAMWPLVVIVYKDQYLLCDNYTGRSQTGWVPAAVVCFHRWGRFVILLSPVQLVIKVMIGWIEYTVKLA